MLQRNSNKFCGFFTNQEDSFKKDYNQTITDHYHQTWQNSIFGSLNVSRKVFPSPDYYEAERKIKNQKKHISWFHNIHEWTRFMIHESFSDWQKIEARFPN